MASCPSTHGLLVEGGGGGVDVGGVSVILRCGNANRSETQPDPQATQAVHERGPFRAALSAGRVGDPYSFFMYPDSYPDPVRYPDPYSCFMYPVFFT